MHIWTSWGVLGCLRVSWGIKTDRKISLGRNVKDTNHIKIQDVIVTAQSAIRHQEALMIAVLNKYV